MSTPFVSARQRAINHALQNIGSSITQRRLLSNLTQTTLAEKAGISRRTLTRIEAGDSGTRLDNLIAVIIALGAYDDLLKTLDPIYDPLLSSTAFANMPQRGKL